MKRFIAGLLCLLLAACSQQQPIAPPVTEPPATAPEPAMYTVTNLVANPASIEAGGASILSWTSSDPVGYYILGTDGSFESTMIATIPVLPTATTTYRVAPRSNQSVGYQDVTVTVSASSAPQSPALEYFLETNCSDGALVTYATVEGGTRQNYLSSGKVYEAFGPFPSPNPFVYISAQNQCDSGFVTVSIHRYGELYLTETSEGAYVIATASGSF